MDDDNVTEGISRRRILKRAGAGAALIWSAPVISSLATPAFAASPPGNECFGCAGNSLCSQHRAPCAPNCHCILVYQGQGACACVNTSPGGFCGPYPECGTLGCPSGHTCVLAMCCIDGIFGPPVCVPNCTPV